MSSLLFGETNLEYILLNLAVNDKNNNESNKYSVKSSISIHTDTRTHAHTHAKALNFQTREAQRALYSKVRKHNSKLSRTYSYKRRTHGGATRNEQNYEKIIEHNEQAYMHTQANLEITWKPLKETV